MQLSFSFQYFDSAVIIATDRKTCSRLETNIISKIVIFLVSMKFMSSASKTNKISGLSPSTPFHPSVLRLRHAADIRG